jgi:hypothetical protein
MTTLKYLIAEVIIQPEKYSRNLHPFSSNAGDFVSSNLISYTLIISSISFLPSTGRNLSNAHSIFLVGVGLSQGQFREVGEKQGG